MKKTLPFVSALCICLMLTLFSSSCDKTEVPDSTDSEQVTETEKSTDTASEETDTEESSAEAESETPEETKAPESSETEPEKPVSVVKFALFSDFHYKDYVYMSTVADMDAIIERAHENEVDFIIQTGDFCNDYAGSPEIMKAYLDNKYDIPAYGVYGNHELESKGNTMETVTPLITSEADSVTWGTKDGKIGDGSIAYYYFDVKGFRIICLDTNYSYNPKNKEWEHVYAGSVGTPSGNTHVYGLGPEQEEWFTNVLNDAADKDIPCLVFSHVGFSGQWYSSDDSMQIRKIFREVNKKNKGTVLAAFNGHLHTNHATVLSGILYMDVNTVRNGSWIKRNDHHYTDETFVFQVHDGDGNFKSTKNIKLTMLNQSKNTWFFTDPLSCIVTISSDGKVTVDGSKSTWLGGIEPPNKSSAVTPEITSKTYKVKGKK